MIHTVAGSDGGGTKPNPGHTRTQIDKWWVDWDGTIPTEQEVLDWLNPPPDKKKKNDDDAAAALLASDNEGPVVTLLQQIKLQLDDQAKRLDALEKKAKP